MAVFTAGGRIVIPVLIQQILDEGILSDEGFRPGFILTACGLALVVTLAVLVLSRLTYIRLVTAAESMLRNLRVRTFAHVHRLSVADHNEANRGLLTARVTSDIETIARFAQWGAMAWIVNTVVIVGVLVVMAVYSVAARPPHHRRAPAPPAPDARAPAPPAAGLRHPSAPGSVTPCRRSPRA